MPYTELKKGPLEQIRESLEAIAAEPNSEAVRAQAERAKAALEAVDSQRRLEPRLTETVTIRCTLKQKERWERQATIEGKTVPDWIRGRLL